MTFWTIPVWIVSMGLLALALIGVLTAILHAHHTLHHRVTTLTRYSEEDASDLQRRVRRAVTSSAAERASLTRRMTADQLSVETQAMRAVLDAERKDKEDAPHQRR